MAKKKFYVTTPIYYPTGKPHIGTAYTTIAADIIARWHRQKGYDVFALTGTDENAKKVFQTAKKAGKDPGKFIDELASKFKDVWDELGLHFDRFIRTTDADHVKIVKEILKKAYDKGDIYKGIYEGYYCTECEAYYTEKDLDNFCCPIHKKKAELLKEESYFFKLSKYQKKLLELYKKNPEFILPKKRRNEVINRVRDGLKDLSISRKDYGWGIKLPFDETHVVYVWYDALTNYYSATRKKGKEKFWPADVHLIGKDILWFHAVIWPAMLLSLGIKIPKTIFAHGWWTVEGSKISKSLGNAVDPLVISKKYGNDTLRYFLFRAAPFGEDGDFSEKALTERHNNELANKLGNLVSRVAGLIERIGVGNKGHNVHLDKKWKEEIIKGNIQYEIIPRSDRLPNGDNIYTLTKKSPREVKGLLLSYPIQFLEAIELLVGKQIDDYQFDKALSTIFSFIDFCNRYIQDRKIWEKKSKTDLYELKESILKIAELLYPFIPESAEKIKKQFSAAKIKKGEILFKKIK